MVAATEVPADFAVGCRGVLSRQEHCQHPRVADKPGALLRLQGSGLQTQHVANGAVDVGDLDNPDRMAKEVAQGFASHRQVDRPARHAAEVLHTVQGALQFAHIAAQLSGQQAQHFIG